MFDGMVRDEFAFCGHDGANEGNCSARNEENFALRDSTAATRKHLLSAG